MASRNSFAHLARLALLVIAGCEAGIGPRIIHPPDSGADDLAAPLDAHAVDARSLDATVDAAPGLEIDIDDAPLAACDRPTVPLAITLSAPAEVIPIVAGVSQIPRRVRPGEPVILEVAHLPDGAHPVALAIGGIRHPGPQVIVDRTAPRIDWPAAPDACVPQPPEPVFDEPVEWSREAGRLGCTAVHRIEAVDGCGHRSVSRRAWRVGPPGPPTVEGVEAVEGEAALRWQAAPDGCSGAISATLGRVGEPARAYVAGTPIEWPGEYLLTLTVEGCNGPAEHRAPVTIAPGLCDAPTRPLDTAPRVRGWLEITTDRLVALSIEWAALEPAIGAAMREAATRLAGHPGFPDACPARQSCSTAADRALALAALDRASAALADRPGGRAARRCLAEAARVIVAARAHGEEACAAPDQAVAEALVDAWIVDDDARATVGCLCAGCAPPPAPCADAAVLRADPDPVRFAAQVEALAGEDGRRCLFADDCAALVAATDAALEAGACSARTLLSVTRLLIGRKCSGVGRFRHPGLLALDAALARWPLWPAAAPASRADLARAVDLCGLE